MGRSRPEEGTRRSSARSIGIAVAVLALVLGCAGAPARASGGLLPAPCDLNGDGYSELIIGAPGSHEGHLVDGSVLVTFGSATGLRTDRVLTLREAGTAAERGYSNRFGAAITCGDFDGDGFADVAVGVPGEWRLRHHGAVTAGAVYVFYGSVDGPTGARTLHVTQSGTSTPYTNEGFGAALATGDVNRDGYADLAVGAPQEHVAGSGTDARGYAAGGVTLFPGSRNGLRRVEGRLWTQDSPGVKDAAEPPVYDVDHRLVSPELFGAALAMGDLNGDGYVDLAIGVPGETITSSQTGHGKVSGATQVLFGTRDGLTPDGDQFWSQDSPGVKDAAEQYLSVDTDIEWRESFGGALAVARFNGDRFADLAIGVPMETVRARSALSGAVHVLFGSSRGPTADGDEFWHLGQPGVKGSPSPDLDDTPGDLFGSVLSPGDFDGDGRADLAIGAWLAPPGGRVHILRGSAGGLTAAGDQMWSQATAGIRGTGEDDDLFGYGLSVGRFGRTRHDDLAIGSPGEHLGSVGRAGRVHVLYGSAAGLSASGSQVIDRTTAGIPGAPRLEEYLGAALGGTHGLRDDDVYS